MTTTLVTTLVVASLTASVILIATKHHTISLAPSIFASILVIFALLPSEPEGEEISYAYSAGGGVRVGKSAPKTRINASPAQTPPPTSQAPLPTFQAPPPSLPVCAAPPAQPTNQEMKDHIRDNGLYGVHGNLSCKRLQRGTVADSGMLQPLNARNQLLKFLSVDQQHAKDPHLIPRKRMN
jgi:hypothetical protein